MGDKSENINFFTPIHYEEPSSFKDDLLQKVDNYFYLGGRKAVVLPGQAGIKDKAVAITNVPASHVKKIFFGALKIVSYLTIVMPLLMLCLKTALRWNTKFHKVKLLSAPSSSPQQGDVFTFGDVHGELKGFQENLEYAGLIDSKTKHWCGGKAIMVQMGDVLQRGPLSKESYQFLETLQQEAPKTGGQVVRLIGNHELMVLQGEFAYVDRANIPDPQKMSEQIKEDIRSGKVQLAYTDGTRLYIHGGERSPITALITKQIGLEIKEKGKEQVPFSPQDLERIANRLNEILIEAVTKNNFSHPIFWVGMSRGGDKPVGGVLWTDAGEVLQSRHARDIPQVIAHRPPEPGEPFIRMTESMRLINVDAGLCSYYGGHHGFVKIGGGKIANFQKISGVWQKVELKDKLGQK